MNAFDYHRAVDVADAVRLGQAPGAMYIGGGTNLLDLMKGGVATPQRLVDVSRLPLVDVAVIRCLRRRCSPAPRRSCATWPP